MKPIIMLTILMALFSMRATAQDGTMPRGIKSMDLPSYPQLARMASVQGVVRLGITIDGAGTVIARALEGHPLLTEAAEQNARSWQFFTKPPAGSFIMTYRYRIDDKATNGFPSVAIRLPTEIEVSTDPFIEYLAPSATQK